MTIWWLFILFNVCNFNHTTVLWLMQFIHSCLHPDIFIKTIQSSPHKLSVISLYADVTCSTHNVASFWQHVIVLTVTRSKLITLLLAELLYTCLSNIENWSKADSEKLRVEDVSFRIGLNERWGLRPVTLTHSSTHTLSKCNSVLALLNICPLITWLWSFSCSQLR